MMRTEVVRFSPDVVVVQLIDNDFDGYLPLARYLTIRAS